MLSAPLLGILRSYWRWRGLRCICFPGEPRTSRSSKPCCTRRVVGRRCGGARQTRQRARAAAKLSERKMGRIFASSGFCSATRICRRRRAIPASRPASLPHRRDGQPLGSTLAGRDAAGVGGEAGAGIRNSPTSSGVTAPATRKKTPPISGASSGAFWRRSRPVGQPRPAVMSSAGNDCGLTRIAYNSCPMGRFRNGELATA